MEPSRRHVRPKVEQGRRICQRPRTNKSERSSHRSQAIWSARINFTGCGCVTNAIARTVPKQVPVGRHHSSGPDPPFTEVDDRPAEGWQRQGQSLLLSWTEDKSQVCRSTWLRRRLYRGAYCAVAYMCIEREDEYRTSLVAAKTRVAPSTPMTIARLELLAALILARLVSAVREALTQVIHIEEVFCWNDSITVFTGSSLTKNSRSSFRCKELAPLPRNWESCWHRIKRVPGIGTRE